MLPSGKFVPVSISVAPLIRKAKAQGAIIVFRDYSREKEIDTAKSEFVSLASHQLRTPLTAMKWYLELLLEKEHGTINEDQQLFLEEAYSNSVRMNDLVNALLDVSRIDLQTFSSEMQQVHVRDVLATVIEDLQKVIKEKKLVVHVEIKKTLPTLFLDPKVLQIVFQNLLSNATKYTSEGGEVNVEMHLVQKSELFHGKRAERDSVGVLIKDTGYGIPEDQQSKIFLKFFRADNVRKLDTDGNGLGLYIVQSVVHQLHGEIWLTSHVGKGTSFMLLLPVEK